MSCCLGERGQTEISAHSATEEPRGELHLHCQQQVGLHKPHSAGGGSGAQYLQTEDHQEA